MKKAPEKKAQTAAAKPPVKPTGASKKAPVTNQVQIDANNPIPLDNGGVAFSFVSGVSYLPFLPPVDNYARQLLETRLLSVTHNACINTKKRYCAGLGFQDADSKELPQPMQDWFKSMNLKNEPAAEINNQIFEGKFTWGNVPVEIVKFTVGGKKRLFIYAHDVQEWRLGNPDDNDMVTYGLQSKL